MTSISDVTTTAGTTIASSTAGASGVMGKDDFLKLLVAQLQHQDPLNPADPTEFTAQLSQFSSLEQLFAVNDNLEKMVAENGGMERFSALSLIDREVVSTSNSFLLGENGVELGYRLDRPANSVNLIIQDQLGRTLATLPATETEAGDHFFSWDGTDEAGNIIPPGEYTMIVSAQRSNDDVFAGTALIKGIVTGVDLNGAENKLITDAGVFQMSDILSVRSQDNE